MQPTSPLQGIKKYIPSLRVIEIEKENRLLRNENAALKEENAALKEENAVFKTTIQDLLMRIEELERMIFKRPKKKKGEDSAPPTPPMRDAHGKRRKKRDAASYRRSIPTEDEVTTTEEHTLDACTHCGGHIEEWDVRDYFIEDIPEPKKEVVHHRIHIYGCTGCGKRQSSIPVPRGNDVVLGPRVKAFILFHTYIIKTSAQEIIASLKTWYNLTISEGEIHLIHQEAASRLLPIYNSIADSLNAVEANNMDETGWKIKGEQWYLWGRGSPTIPETLYHIGSRGKGNVEQLLDGFSGCLTSDCYGAYKNLPEDVHHQICWVHLLRNAKDVADADALTDEQRQSAAVFRDGMYALYGKVKSILDQPYDERKRRKQASRLRRQLRSINHLLPCDTPKKLKNVKLLTQTYEQELFTCL